MTIIVSKCERRRISSSLVTSNLALTTKLRNHDRGRDGQREICPRLNPLLSRF